MSYFVINPPTLFPVWKIVFILLCLQIKFFSGNVYVSESYRFGYVTSEIFHLYHKCLSLKSLRIDAPKEWKIKEW